MNRDNLIKELDILWTDFQTLKEGEDVSVKENAINEKKAEIRGYNLAEEDIVDWLESTGLDKYLEQIHEKMMELRSRHG